ncbi:MAG: GntR family transcriptional regulator [Alphaproteobacteria bacterium]|nr:GntR family transcriptional regulator [Alphaproteobacteria bacterium]
MPADTLAPRPLQAALVSAKIVDAVLEAIAHGRLTAGTRLREEEIAGIFGASRAAVREALKALAERGVAVLQPNRGARVASPTEDEVTQTYAARALIEGAMAADLAQHITAADIRKLREHIGAQRRTNDSGERREHLRLMGDFHTLLATLHGNPVVTETLERLVARTSFMTALFPPPTQICAIDDHVAMVDALAKGDGALAQRLASKHMMDNRARLRVAASAQTADLRAALLPA